VSGITPLERVIQFTHPEKLLAARGFRVVEDRVAEFFGVSREAYFTAREAFTGRVGRVADELLADEAFAARVDQLPFQSAQTVLAMGDSLTDDYQSWFEMLKALVARRRPGDAVRWVNAAMSGNTTLEMVARASDAARVRPDWVFILAGTNDARRHGREASAPLLEASDTARQLVQLRALLTQHGPAELVWLVPPSVLPERIAADPFLNRHPVMWNPADVAAAAAVVRGMGGRQVDVWERFGDPPRGEWLSDDGVHPSLAGQREMAVAVVEALTTG
jgi:lysophospholipase L1-like esterase